MRLSLLLFLAAFSLIFRGFNGQDLGLIEDILSDYNASEIQALLQQANSAVITTLCKNNNRTKPPEGEENLCYKQLGIVCDNDFFISRMSDASSKLPYSGMLVETKVELGNWEECVELHVHVNGTRVIGKHCLAALIIPTTDLDSPNFFQEAYKLSLCIPDGCTAKDLNSLLNLNSNSSVINDYSCSTKDSWKTMNTLDYYCILFFIVFTLFIVMTTSYDVYCRYKEIENVYFLSKAFSFYSNGKKLFKMSKANNTDQVQVIHGLKVISMMWIVLGHVYALMAVAPVNYESWIDEIQFSWGSFYYTTAYLGVDTFFLISGFLLAYQYLKQSEKSLRNHLKNVPCLYMHRYLRLTPPVFAAYVFVVGIYSHFAEGPLFLSSLQSARETCVKYWWTFFLYIQNYANYDDICLIQTWYLSADFQLFLVSPIVFIPVAMLVKNHLKSVLTSLFMLNIAFTVIPMSLALVYNKYDNEFESHTRLNVYFLGFTLGVLMRQRPMTPYKLNRRLNLIIWTIVLVVMGGVVFVYKFIQLRIHDGFIYATIFFILLRYLWGLCLCWVIYACHTGYGGIINKFLTLSPFIFMNKLTYCMYIVHVLPICTKIFKIRNKMYIQVDETFNLFVSVYVVTVLLSILWTLAFESPIIIIQKQMWRKQ